jgi:hypothetical protein
MAARTFMMGGKVVAESPDIDALPDEAQQAGREEWWRWEELNLRHGAYETPALPLSYTAEPSCDAKMQAGILP